MTYDRPVFVIEGSRIITWQDLVSDINAFIPESIWQGNSLDTIDDILYGGYGTPDAFVVVWRSSELSRQRLGYDATKRYHSRVQNFDERYRQGHIQTLFDTMVEIFQGHENIELRLE
jgi:hypothetical protein